MQALIRKPVFILAPLALGFLLFWAKSGAQTTLVTLVGTVADEQGSPLPGASVMVKNIETGYTRSGMTRADGRYIISGLQAGRYECQVSLQGFMTEIQKGLTFAVGARVTIDFRLKLATIEEQVTVTAQAPMVETTKSEVSAIVDRIKIDSLPLLDRDFSALTLVKAGVLATEYTEMSNEIRSNAQPYGSEDILTDGVSNEWVGRNIVNMAIPADAIQEFRIMTNQYEAEYGNSSGMVRSVLTRSGTNDFHGRVAFLFRDEFFDDVNYFVNHEGYQGRELRKHEYEKIPFSHYNWSVNFGGPIKKDKAHFFFIYEGTSHREYSTVTSPLVEKETVPWNRTNNQLLLKFDYQLNEKNCFSFRYGLNRPRDHNKGAGGLYTKTTAYDSTDVAHDFHLNWTNYPSDKMMNEVRLFYSYESYAIHSAYDDNSYHEVRPSGYFGAWPNHPQECSTRRYQLVENFTLFLGDHNLKFGIDASRIYMAGYLNLYLPGMYFFDTDEPFDRNNSSTYPYLLIRSNKTMDIDLPYWEVGVFAQDSWRVTPRLTLNYGLRYNYYQIRFLDIDTFNIRHFNPRLGFAWDPIGDGKTSIKGGIGTYSQNPQANLGLIVGIMNQLDLQYIFYPGYPDPSVPSPFVPPTPVEPPPSIYKAEQNIIAPYTVQTTLGFQKEFLTDLSFGFDLVWSKGHKLSRIENDNPIIPGTGFLRPDMSKADIFVIRMRARSDYKALYVTVSKRYSHRWFMDIAYTLSKSMSDVEFDVSEPYSYDPDGWDRMYGPTDFDARHRLAVTGIIDLPWGFQLSGLAYYRSALPWTPFYLTDVNQDGLLSDMEPGKHRNSRRGFDQFYLNLRLSKYIKIDRSQVQVFAEVYNLLNRANFGNILPRINSPDFGNPATAGDPRRFQFGARFDF